MTDARFARCHGDKRFPVTEYSISIGLVALATGLRMLLEPAMGLSVPYVTFFLSNALIIRLTGTGPSILAILLSTAAADFFFMPPKFTLLSDGAQYFTSFLFILANAVIMALAHAMRTAKEQAEHDKTILQAVFDGAKNSHLAFLDRNFDFVRVNETYARTCGYKPEELIGRNHFALYPNAENEAIFARVRDTGMPVAFADKPFEFPDQPERGVTYWDWTLSPVKDTDGNVVGLVFSLFETTERKQLNEALRRAKEELRQHAQQLEEIVEERTSRLQEAVGDLEHLSYTLSHDLRAPLRTMEGFPQLMLESGCATCCNSESKEFLQRISTGARRMNALISDALDYSRAARTELQLTPVDVKALLQTIVSTHPNLHAESAEIVIEDTFPQVLGNKTALTQCFANLLSNAVKFVKPGVKPRVRIWSEPQGDSEVRLWVGDNGIGIAEKDRAKLFGMFQRLTADYEGTGIGLALVRKNVERMGGSAGVESEPGEGSRFWIQLRQAKSPALERA
ncbi:MAG: ATP-binding protein [Verrucomicrobiia bacterium]